MSTENTVCVNNSEINDLVDEDLLRAAQMVYAMYDTRSLFSDSGISDFSDPNNKVLENFSLKTVEDVTNQVLGSRYCSMSFPEHVTDFFLRRKQYPITKEHVVTRMNAAFEQTRGRGLSEAEGKQVWWIWRRYFFIIPESLKTFFKTPEEERKATVRQISYLLKLIKNSAEINDSALWLTKEKISVYLLGMPANPFISFKEASSLIDFLKASPSGRQQGNRREFARSRTRYFPY